MSAIDAWEHDQAAPEDKRKRSKPERKGRKQAEKAVAEREREREGQAGEQAVDEAAMHAERGTGEEWLGKQEEPMETGKGKGKGKEKAVTAIEDSY